jgi:hypothetical protein
MSTGRLPRRKEAAIAALLTSASIAAAAEKIGVSERTLRVWLKDVTFASEYRAARASILEHALGVCQGAAISAVSCLLRNTTCGKAAVEVAAAGKLLEHSIGAVELFDLSQRVAELEQQIKAQGAGYANRGTFPNGQAHNGQSR